MKKEWKTPQLISVYRARPEEAVLFACKNNNGRGPAFNAFGCLADLTFPGFCSSTFGS